MLKQKCVKDHHVIRVSDGIGVWMLLGSLMLSLPVAAGSVKMFQDVPSAKEMARLMFPEKTVQTKFRSIRLAPKPSEQKESVGIALPIQFAYNSAEIKRGAQPFLDEVGRMLNLAELKGERIVIEGHTDASGSEYYNVALSWQRAKAVQTYLVSAYAIAPGTLTIKGIGEAEPLSGYNPYDGLNRRVEFHRAK